MPRRFSVLKPPVLVLLVGVDRAQQAGQAVEPFDNAGGLGREQIANTGHGHRGRGAVAVGHQARTGDNDVLVGGRGGALRIRILRKRGMIGKGSRQ